MLSDVAKPEELVTRSREKFRPNLRRRIVLRLLGVRISDGGLRWTASRRHQRLVERAFENAVLKFWQEDERVLLRRFSEGISMDGPNGHIELRWLS